MIKKKIHHILVHLLRYLKMIKINKVITKNSKRQISKLLMKNKMINKILN